MATKKNVKRSLSVKTVSEPIVDPKTIVSWWLPMGYAIRVMNCETGKRIEVDDLTYDLRDRVEPIVRNALEKAGFEVGTDMDMATPYTGSWTGGDRMFRVKKIEPVAPLVIVSEPESVVVDTYETMTVKQLRLEAKTRDIDVSGLKKSEIIDALNE